MKFFSLVLLLMVSCTLPHKIKTTTRASQGKHKFNLKDSSGNYLVEREVKRVGRKVVTRSTLMSWSDTSAPLEKSITVSLVGSVKKGKRSLLPLTSQFSVWFNKKKFFSQIKINKSNKTIAVLKQSPEEKWNGEESVGAPKAKYICFFSSLPECMSEQNLLVLSKDSKVELVIIWDNYPYYVEQYAEVSGKLFTTAQLSFSSMLKDSLRFELDIGNQIIFYHFNRNLEFVKMFWVAQGISLERQKIN